jgi:hypothetical protein
VTSRQELHAVIDRLTEDQLKKVIEAVKSIVEVNPYERMKDSAGIRVPEQWPPRYQSFEAIEISQEGEFPSEQLIRERR